MYLKSVIDGANILRKYAFCFGAKIVNAGKLLKCRFPFSFSLELLINVN